VWRRRKKRDVNIEGRHLNGRQNLREETASRDDVSVKQQREYSESDLQI
jgi:hypothetical protein